MENEKKQCQNCKKDFTIEPDDFLFYEKIKVPPPTFCPECRMMRRLVWFNLINLFYRNCDLCKKRFISMYPAEANYIVYCPKCWWSDKWDFRDFGVDYDFSKPFFEQFDNLMHKAPMLGLSINTTTTPGSPYNNHSADLKDCYLTFHSSFSQECAYDVFLIGSRECFNSISIMNTDSCYDCINLYKSNNCVGLRGNNRFCIDSYFLRDCENCQNCFMCAGLKNKKFYFKNKKYTKDAYNKIISKYNLFSYKGYKNTQKEVNKFWKTIPPKPTWDTMSINCTGSYIFHSKNCHECYDVTDAENCKYCMILYDKPINNCYDISSWGQNLQESYECGVVGENSSNLLFSQESGINITNIEYCKLTLGGNNQFGSVSARRGENVILNKVYSKIEYEKLVFKIKKHMNDMPYIDKKGNVYKYGEFFPMELSPFHYNITFAQLFNPKTKEEIEEYGGFYLKDYKNKYKITKKEKDLPDNIVDTEEDILKEVIECSVCGNGYKIVEIELFFFKKMNLSISHKCPFCMINEKLNIWVDNMKLKNRICNRCKIKFKTHWGKERAPIIYCEKCYQQEIY